MIRKNDSKDIRIIELTSAAKKYGNLYITACGPGFFPKEAIGSHSREKGIGKLLTLYVAGLPSPVKTDIPTDKKTGKPRTIFRERRWVKDFIQINNLRGGDQVTIQRMNKSKYSIFPSNVRRNETVTKLGEQRDSSSITCSSKGEAAKFSFIDLFSGIGGIRLGLEKAGGKCLHSIENNKYACQVYEANFNENPYGDMTKVKPGDIPKHDVLAAGFPCQPFSISGQKKGFQDTRGTLIYHVFEIIEKRSPKVVLLENVKFLIHHDKGRTFGKILKSLVSLGYKATVYSVLNAVDFGVPQNRERIIIVANKDKKFDFSKLKTQRSKPLKCFLDNSNNFEYLKEPYTILDDLKTQTSGLMFAGYRNKKIRQVGVRPNTKHLSRVHKQPNRIYSTEGVHPTIPSQEPSGRFWIYHNNKVRKLTINECYRIMGFPDNFLKSPINAEQYKQIGNSVCVPMFKELGIEIVNQYFGNNYGSR